MKWLKILAVLVAAAGALVLAGGLVLARMLRVAALEVSPDHAPDPYDLEVAELTENTITLRPAARRPRSDAAANGTWGIESAALAYNQVGPVVERRGRDVVREYRHLQGGLAVGDHVRMDPFALPPDPHAAHALAFEDITLNSPLGRFPAWYMEGDTSVWAILVHGKGANRREALRIMPVLHREGLHCLAITYRNDVDCPPDPDGFYAYGRTEWEELEAAAAYALAHGAERLVIVGYSMGGAITMSFMARSKLARHVAALILDAPMLHLGETIAWGATQLRVPRRALAVSNRIVSQRYGVRWGEVDYTSRTAHLDVPILLFHGDADTVIPVALSDAFAEAHPELVTYVRVEGAGHVHAWNVDRPRYETAVRIFLATVSLSPAPA